MQDAETMKPAPLLSRMVRMVAPTRWPLLLGSMLALSLPFVSWFTVQFCGLTCDNLGGDSRYMGVNPLRIFIGNQLSAYPIYQTYIHFAVFHIGVLLAIVLPGIIGSTALRSAIRTRWQLIGSGLLSMWIVGIISLGSYVQYWIAHNSIIYSFAGELLWSNALGVMMFSLMSVLLTVGMLLLWRDMWRAQHAPHRINVTLPQI